MTTIKEEKYVFANLEELAREFDKQAHMAAGAAQAARAVKTKLRYAAELNIWQEAARIVRLTTLNPRQAAAAAKREAKKHGRPGTSRVLEANA